MPGWIRPALVIGILVFIVVPTAALVFWRFFSRLKNTRIGRVTSLQDGIAKLHQAKTGVNRQLDSSSRRRPGYSAFRRGDLARPLFSWADHPSLIMNAVENGWSRFAFLEYKSCSSSLPSLLGACATRDHLGSGESEPEISWEVTQGSADFMQKIRLNPGLMRVNLSSPVAAACVIKTALPLPGPPPRLAYFEITILEYGNDHESMGTCGETDRTKLILNDLEVTSNSGSLVHIPLDRGSNRMEELRMNGKDDGPDEMVFLSVGLTAGGTLPLKLPGTYAGSIGFNSNGSIYLDGNKVVFESENKEWGMTGKVIGCGFDLSPKKVFFTIDSELMQVVHCEAEEYSAPLYPTIAANSNSTILVNFGQGPFKYSPANTHRTSNPCFIDPQANSPALGYDDSTELFSLGRIDSQWLHRSISRGSHLCHPNNCRPVDFYQESEADLFEIALEGTGRSTAAVS